LSHRRRPRARAGAARRAGCTRWQPLLPFIGVGCTPLGALHKFANLYNIASQSQVRGCRPWPLPHANATTPTIDWCRVSTATKIRATHSPAWAPWWHSVRETSPRRSSRPRQDGRRTPGGGGGGGGGFGMAGLPLWQDSGGVHTRGSHFDIELVHTGWLPPS